MQTFDVLIAPGPFQLNFLFFLFPPPLPPFSSLPLWGGITQENRKEVPAPTCLPVYPARAVTRSRLGGGSGPSSGAWLFAEGGGGDRAAQWG